MNALSNLVFHVGGPQFHPVEKQAKIIAKSLGDEYHCSIQDGLAAFESLDDCDLLVLMGLHWTGMTAEWAGSLAYHPLQSRHIDALQRYMESGRPILAHHGAVASYDDCPRFGELVGVKWMWGTTSHSPFGLYQVQVLQTGHDVMQGVPSYALQDELYFDLTFDPTMRPITHAQAMWNEAPRPMVVTGEGGRTPGAGRVVYLANGHDLRAFECDALRTLWRNAVAWLLKKDPV